MSDTNHQASDLSHSLLHLGAWTDSSPSIGPILGPDALGLELGLLACKGKGQTPPLNKPSTPSTKKTSSTKKTKGSKTSTQKGTHTKPGIYTWLQEHYESPWTPYQAAANFNTASPGPGEAPHTSHSKPAGANTPTGFQG